MNDKINLHKWHLVFFLKWVPVLSADHILQLQVYTQGMQYIAVGWWLPDLDWHGFIRRIWRNSLL